MSDIDPTEIDITPPAEAVTPAPARRRFGWEYIVGVLAGIFWFYLAWSGAGKLSGIVDEAPHIAAGYALVRYGDFRFNPEHPPLAKVLYTLPLLWLDGIEPDLNNEFYIKGQEWMWASQFVFFSKIEPKKMIMRSRVVPIIVGFLGGIIAWAWAMQFGGRRAGLFAYLFLLFYPEYLGHSRFVAFDIATAVSCGAVSLAAWMWWKKPTILRAVAWIAAGSVLALVKLPVAVFAGITMILLMVLYPAVRYMRGRFAGGPARFRVIVAVFVLLVLAGYFMQWVGAGFHPTLAASDPKLKFDNAHADLSRVPDTGLGGALRFLDKHRILPQASIATLAHVYSPGAGIYFLYHEYSEKGWYHYFLITTVLKTPILYLIGGIFTLQYLLLLLYRGNGVERSALCVLMIPFLFALTITVISGINIGHRHILFAYIPWSILMGAMAAEWTRSNWPLRIATYGFAIWIIALTTWHQPNQATYFNMLAGGTPYRAENIIMDSNIDWGQDIPAAKAAMDRLGYKRVNMAYFGSCHPFSYGIDDYNFIIGNKPDPKLATVVSLQFLGMIRNDYPEMYKCGPIAICNSMIIYAPME